MTQNLIHPLETANFAELQGNKLLTALLNMMGGTHAGLTSLAEVPDRALIVTEQSFPRLHAAYKVAHDKLALERDYNVFCTFDYNRNARTLGTDDNCILVVDSSCLEDFSDVQLAALLGRELAHIKFRHVKYLTAFSLIDYLVSFLPKIIANAGTVSALKGLLLDYLLAAQFTADRASAFVAGDILPVIQNSLMASGLETADECVDFELYTQITLPEELNQFDRAAKLLMTETLRDFQIPFVIPRIRELAAWAASEESREFLPEVSASRRQSPSKAAVLSDSEPPSADKKNSAPSQTLVSGQRIDLAAQSLKFVVDFELSTAALDIDVEAFLTQADGKVSCDDDCIFYGNVQHSSEAVTLNADKSIDVDLSKVPHNVERISLAATIYDADKLKQNFGMVGSATVRIFDAHGTHDANGELATFPIESLTVETALVLGEVYRHKGAWKFKATGAGFSGGLAALCKNFGVDVE